MTEFSLHLYEDVHVPVSRVEPVPTMAEPEIEDDLLFALKGLHLSPQVTERLYLTLKASKIDTYREAKRRANEVVSALAYAYRVDAMKVIEALLEVERS